MGLIAFPLGRHSGQEQRVRRKRINLKLILTTISIIFLVVSPILRLPLAHALVTSVSAEVKYDNGFPDLVFTAIDGNGGVPDAVTINVTPDGYTSPVFSGDTGTTGVFTAKIAPPANYTWTASGPISETGTRVVNSCQVSEKPSESDPCFVIDVTDRQAFLMQAMSIEFMTCTICNKGLAFLEGLAQLLGYPTDPKNIQPGTANSETAARYLQWLAGLQSFFDGRKSSIPGDTWDTINIEIAGGRETLQDLGRISHIIPDFNCQTDRTGITEACVGGLIRWGTDVASIVSGFLKLGVALHAVGAAAGTAAAAVLIIVVFITTIVQIWDLHERYPTWGSFLTGLTSDPTVWVEILSIVGGLIIVGAAVAAAAGLITLSAASAATGVGIVIAAVAAAIAIGLLVWNWYQSGQQEADLRARLTGQVTQLYGLRETLKNTNTTRLRQESQTMVELASVTGQVGSLASDTVRNDFLWMSYYFSRLSTTESSFADKVERARNPVDQLLVAYLHYQNKTSGKNLEARLEGYNATRAEFPGTGNYLPFTFNATIYGRQTDGQIGFAKHIVDPKGDLGALDGKLTTETDVSNVVIWGSEPKSETDGQGNNFLPVYAPDSTNLPNSNCTTGEQFCFPKVPLTFICGLSSCTLDTISRNEAYSANSAPVLDKQGNPQSFFLYKWFLDSATEDCFLCGTHNDALREWSANISSATPATQRAVDQVGEAFREHESVVHLKKPSSFPFAFSTQWPMILPGGPVAVSPSVVAVDPSGETNRLGLETHGLPAIWYLRCGGTLNLCDLNRLDPSTNQTAHWILGKDLLSGIEAPPGTKPSGIVINNSTGDIFWTMNRTDGEQIWRKSPSPGSGFMLTFDTFTYWNTSLASGAWGLTLDSQGNPVFAEANTNSISQLVLESNLIRRFNVGTAVKHLVGDPSNPNEVWFTEENANKIGRLDISTCEVPTCGLLYEWSIPTAVSQPSGITIDSNGNVWFAETAANQIARLDTATNNIFEYPTGTVKSPRQIALSGPDQLFVTEASGAVDVVSTGSSSAYVNGGTSTHVDPASRQLDFQSALASYATPALQYFVYPTVPTKATLYGSDLGGVERFPLQSASNPQGISEGVGVSNMFYADFGLSSITRFDGPVASISPVNSPPVAAADFDRIVEGNTKGGAIVTLDGSKSSDSDSDPLTFRWTGDFGTATGVSPSVFLSLGTHKVELIVNDGHVDSDPAFVQITVVDSTPPIIAAQRSPFPNLFDWTNQTVKVSFSCSDVVWDVPAPNRVYFGSEGRNQTATRTCTDGSGNSASTTLTDINIDKTPPFPDPLAPCRTVPPANQNGWYNTSVTTLSMHSQAFMTTLFVFR